ncbi:UNVERIFIED_CONTAM: putative pentatricopeptide repeat-containing protein, mitochondrial [Sesamum latifolium]|uniref:Pentatricopeptide repeat-containing protein, mitochondrial n=1 Tax=Sesamum latifolium TaxID=2727402 RepID=A0AAW2VLA8_9LAMI
MKFKDYDAVLNECVNHKSLRGGQRVQAHMMKTHYLPPVYLRTRLIVLYVKCEVLSDARMVFDEMPERNVVSWTAMISGYSKSGLYSEALSLFVEMIRSGTCPNEFTFATVLTSCMGAYGFEYGRQIHSLIVKSPFELHMYVGSSLLDLYAKSGRIHEARIIFEGLPERDVVSCTAIISGYAQLGHDREALGLFCTLQREGMTSNYVTYASVLTALSGLAAFEYGRQVHGHVLRSELSFYTVLQNSLIDMYSKCGNLTYARSIFDKMQEKNCYLLECNASRVYHGGMENKGLKFFDEMAGKYATELGIEHYGVHRNIGVGEIAGNRLLELEPENAGNYVILCNLYASNGKWDEVRKVRELMKEQAVMKEPGKSWIEFGRTLHTFYASDRSHPRKEEVLCKLRELSDRIKEVGYNPELSCVLYDVDEEQKEKMLLGHSEKLALAFAMMNVSEAKPIRIMKNLRICVDCHKFARFVSQVYVREILIRDKSRFHHIVNGVCSCGDYW